MVKVEKIRTDLPKELSISDVLSACSHYDNYLSKPNEIFDEGDIDEGCNPMKYIY